MSDVWGVARRAVLEDGTVSALLPVAVLSSPRGAPHATQTRGKIQGSPLAYALPAKGKGRLVKRLHKPFSGPYRRISAPALPRYPKGPKSPLAVAIWLLHKKKGLAVSS